MLPSTRDTTLTSPSQSFSARSPMMSKTGCTSVGEPEITRRISLIAVCCSSASFVSLNRRTLSIAIAAWRANVSTSATWSGEKRPGSRRKRKMPPYAPPSRISGTPSTARNSRLTFSAAPGNSVSRNGDDVGDMNGRAVHGRAPGDRRAVVRYGQADESRVDRIIGRRHEPVSLDDHHACVGRVAQVRGALGHRLQHRLHVGRRARDHAQDLADRRLLLERIGELARARLDLALEVRVRLLQLRPTSG